MGPAERQEDAMAENDDVKDDPKPEAEAEQKPADGADEGGEKPE